MLVPLAALIAQGDIFGTVVAPPGVREFGAGPGGIVIFMSNLIRLVVIIAGIFGLFNIISAGFTIISSSGNPKAMEQANSSLFYSLIGLSLMVGSFAITAIVSFLLFGNAMYILSPTIPTPGGTL